MTAREFPSIAPTGVAALEDRPVPPWRRMARAARAVLATAVNRFDPPVVILAYHRVTRLDGDPHELAVWPERFSEQLQRLRGRFPVLRFESPWPRTSRPAVVLTFDDGYADNLHEALPLLDRFESPACFFVTTGPVESGREFWWDALERYLLTSRERPPRLTLRFGEGGQSWSTATWEERRALHDTLHARLKRWVPEARDACLEELRQWSGESTQARASHRPLTVNEVRAAAAASGVTVGAHTVNHPALSALPPERQRQELAGARDTLERWLERPVTVASFPFGGRRDWDATSLELAHEIGYTRNASNLPRSVHRWSDSLCLPRHLVRNWNGEEFERRLAAFLRT